MEEVANHGETELADMMSRFLHAFIASFIFIIVSELGDKTFFIAAIMAMKHPRMVIFTSSILALALMTTLSVLVGITTKVIPHIITHTIASVLLLLCGLKMLWEAYNMKPDQTQEEIEEVSAELNSTDIQKDIENNNNNNHTNSGTKLLRRYISPIFLQTFTIIFLAEWGDRSQLTTIVMAAKEEPIGITLGGIMGHALCTGLAVIGGKFIAERISTRTVTLIGGIMFIIFAVYSFIYTES